MLCRLHTLLRVNHLSESSFLYPGLLLKVKGGEGEEEQRTCSSTAPLKLPVAYITVHGEVLGVLSVTPYVVMFDPLVTDHRYAVTRSGEVETKFSAVHFQVCIDVQDIVCCTPVAVPTEIQTSTYFLHFTVQPNARGTEPQQRIFATFRYENVINDLNAVCDFVNHVVMECPSVLPQSCTCLPLAETTQSEEPAEPSSPLLSSPSCILSELMALRLRVHLTSLHQIKKWQCIYSSANMGFSYSLLLSSCHGQFPTLLVVMDSAHYVFGGFAASAWEPNKTYFGTGDSFLFSFGDSEELQVYRPTYFNEYYQACDMDCFSLGSDPKPGLMLNRDLVNGMSSHCLTYENKPLASEEYFKLLNIEIWAFE